MRGNDTRLPTVKRCVNWAPVVLMALGSLTLAHEAIGEAIVTEIEKLSHLREKLVIRRRLLVERFQRVDPDRLTGDSMVRIQSAIESVDRAIEDERSTQDARRRAAPVS
jgi:hypothetical protein